MFPYNKPGMRQPSTSREIQEFGRQSLLRALNIGRVILMTGSGASTQFGQPSWAMLKDKAIELAEGFRDEVYKPGIGDTSPRNPPEPNRQHELWQEINSGRGHLEAPTFIEMIQEYYRLVEAEGKKAQDCDAPTLSKFRGKMADIFQLNHSQATIDPKWGTLELPLDVDRTDAPRAFATQLNVWRYLTLNYDLELEQMLFEEVRGAAEEPDSQFADFLKVRTKLAPERWHVHKGQECSLESGTGRLIRSTSSRPNTLADLFTFGAFPQNFNSSVHHLHGRLDDPKNMILSAKDYQRVYFGNTHQKRSFDEARSVVFTGSDIVVVGLGITEHDVFEPWRNFLENEGVAEDGTGKVYYYACASIDVSKLPKPKDLAPNKFIEVWLDSSKQKSANLVQQLYQTYGIYTLIVDDPQQFEGGDDKATQDQTHADFFAQKSNFEKERLKLLKQLHFCRVVVEYLLEHLKDSNLPFVPSQINEAFRAVCSTGEAEPEIQMVQWLLKNWWQLFASKNDTREARLELARSRLYSRALVIGIELLQVQKADWWRDWSELPSFRLSVYGPYYDGAPSNSLTREAPLVWKQSNLVADFRTLASRDFQQVQSDTGLETEISLLGDDQRERRKQLYSLLKLTQQAGSDEEKRRKKGGIKGPRVARVSMPSGSGKGRLMALLFSKHRFQCEIDKEVQEWLFRENNKPLSDIEFPFQRLFGDGTKSGSERYIGGFMAHLTFNIEFNSVIVGFCRFVQQLLPTFYDRDKPLSDAKLNSTFNHLIEIDFAEQTSTEKSSVQIIREMFEFLVEIAPKTENWDVRALAVFSNLGRLVNKEGEGYSPYHRMFFRLINVSENPAMANLPFDFLFINSKTDCPIHYLSKEISAEEYARKQADERDNSNYKLVKSKGVALAHWHKVSPVNIPFMLNEGLNLAIDRLLVRDENLAESMTQIPGGERPFIALRNIAIDACDLATLPDAEAAFESTNLSSGTMKWPISLYDHSSRKVVFGHVLGALIAEIAFVHFRLVLNRIPDPATSEILNCVRDEARQFWHRVSHQLASRIRGDADAGLFHELFKIYSELDQLISPVGANDSGQLTRRLKVSQRYEKSEKIRVQLLNHLALFGHPISQTALMVCPMIVALNTDENAQTFKDAVLAELTKLNERGFVAKLEKHADLAKPYGETSSGEANSAHSEYLYALNSNASEAVRADMRLKIIGRPQRIAFQPTIFPSQVPSDIKPDGNHFLVIREIMEGLLQRPVLEGSEIDCAQFNELSQRVRAAYMLLRGTFSIDVISRLSSDSETLMGFRPFDEYRRWTREILNLAVVIKTVQSWNKKVSQPPIGAPYLNIWAPLYREEATWLYNERALVSFTQGRLFDALPLFNLAQSNTQAKGRNFPARSGGATRRRVALNQGVTWLERGNIQSAKTKFRQIVDESQQRWSSDTISTVPIYARGYLALCSHLSDDILSAENEYNAVLNELTCLQQTRDQEEARGQSIFSRHYADLLRAKAKRSGKQNFKGAQEALNNSEQIAQSINALDLKHYSMIARARLLRDQDNRSDALACLREAEQFATRMGLYKMMVEVLKVRGELLLEEGEATQAGIVTAGSVAMAKRNGMRLRKISAVIIQARILIIRHQFVDACRLLKEALREAETLGYFIKSGEAQSLIQSLDYY